MQFIVYSLRILIVDYLFDTFNSSSVERIYLLFIVALQCFDIWKSLKQIIPLSVIYLLRLGQKIIKSILKLQNTLFPIN